MKAIKVLFPLISQIRHVAGLIRHNWHDIGPKAGSVFPHHKDAGE